MFPICKEILLRQFTRWELKDLLKAISLSKPIARQGLVLVERTVQHKNSKTFTQKFYVRPDQVKKTDRIIAGHHNLLDGHPSKPAKLRSFGDTTKITDDIRQQTAKFFDTFKTPTDFYNYIKHLGIHWKESDKPGIIMMRAKMALNNAQMNGLKLEDISPNKLTHRKKLSTTQPAPASQPTSASAPASAAQPTPAAQPVPAPKPAQPTTQTATKPSTQSTPTTQPAAQSTSAAQSTPKPATQSAPAAQPAPVPKKSITDLAEDFVNSFTGPREFCRAMESMKIPYQRSYDHAKNLAGAKRALIKYMENGVDVPALWKMDTKRLYNSLPSLPPSVPPTIQNSSTPSKSFDTIKEVTNFWMGKGSSHSSPDSNSPYGKWLSSVPSIFVRDMDDSTDKPLVKLERKIINIYTRHSRDFNHWLRGNFAAKTWGIGSFGDIPQLVHFFRRAKFMDDAINRFEVPEPITVHRHMPCTPELLNKILKAPNGIFSDDSYMSTSCLSKMEPQLALKFKQTLKPNETPVHLEIDIPQGKGWGMYVAADSAYPDQCEFLLARGSQLKIDSIQRQPDGSYYVKCKLAGNTQKDVTKLKYRQFIKKSESPVTLDAQLIKSKLLSKLDNPDEDPWERFLTPLDFNPSQPSPERQVNWN